MTEMTLEDRVRQVIAKSGLAQQAFGMQLGIDPTKLSKSLSGNRRFTTYELAAIAEHGGTTVDWLLTGVLPELSRVATRMATTSTSSIEKALQRATALAEVDEALRKLLGETELTPLPGWNANTGKAVRQGEVIGTVARRFLNDRCADSFLRQPEAAIEQAFDVNVTCIPLDRGFDGLAWATPSFRLIVLNVDVRQWTRRRFTLVHELMHIVAGDTQADGFTTDEDVMRTGRAHAEMRANAAAAAFLMPTDQVRQSTDRTHLGKAEFGKLVRDFRVSPSAMAWRLLNLGIIDAGRCEEFRALTLLEAARLGGWQSEYEVLSLETRQQDERLPIHLASRALRAYLDGTITARVLGKAIDVDADTVRNFFVGRDASATDSAATLRASVGDNGANSDDPEAVFEP